MGGKDGAARPLSQKQRERQNKGQNLNQSGRWTVHPRTTAQFIHNLAEKAPGLVTSAVTYSKSQSAAFWDTMPKKMIHNAQWKQ